MVEDRAEDNEAHLQKFDGMFCSLSTPRSYASLASRRPDEPEAIRERVLVNGGLYSSPSQDDAEGWLSSKRWELYGPQSQAIFSKGDLRSLIFARFLAMVEYKTEVWPRLEFPKHP